GGHRCPVARALGGISEREEVVVAQESETRLSSDHAATLAPFMDAPELYVEADLRGYGWYFPKGDWVNVGLGCTGGADGSLPRRPGGARAAPARRSHRRVRARSRASLRPRRAGVAWPARRPAFRHGRQGGGAPRAGLPRGAPARRVRHDLRDEGGRPVSTQTRARDARAIAHHYDVSNDLYSLFLDPLMLYTCAYYRDPAGGLEQAQADKLDLVCRKLRLAPDETLLDLGCGWGGPAIWAVQHYGVRAL